MGKLNYVKLPFYLKIIGLFSVVRGYNVLTLVIAQYLTSIFVFNPNVPYLDVVLDFNLFLIVLASVCVVSSGYIINNFYDTDTDRINKPIKARLDGLVGQQTKLYIYFTLNFIGVAIAFVVSWKAAAFFAGYIFLIWFYSHKLRRFPLISLVYASILMLLPFFVIFIYYKNFSTDIFIHAIYLFFLIVLRELLKNLENLTGDVLTEHITVPIEFGERFTKRFIYVLILLLVLPMYYLVQKGDIGLMKYYFYLSFVVLMLVGLYLRKAKTKTLYLILHNAVKLLIFAGVFSLILIRLHF